VDIHLKLPGSSSSVDPAREMGLKDEDEGKVVDSAGFQTLEEGGRLTTSTVTPIEKLVLHLSWFTSKDIEGIECARMSVDTRGVRYSSRDSAFAQFRQRRTGMLT
jgi:hypothetical protein